MTITHTDLLGALLGLIAAILIDWLLIALGVVLWPSCPGWYAAIMVALVPTGIVLGFVAGARRRVNAYHGH